MSILDASFVGKINLQSKTPVGGGGGTASSPRQVSKPFVPEVAMPNFRLSFVLPASAILMVCLHVGMQPGRTVM
jgi:hypothetical protein